MKKIGCFLLSLVWCMSMFADEGMWMLNSLKKDNWTRMRELGFLVPAEQLYDTITPCIKDAVVHFDGGCTGITVSEKGLIFTNHHCGYGAIQSQSSLEHDYLTDGFVAQTQEEEIPIPDMFVRYLIKTEDVTEQVLSQVTGDIKNEEERLNQISKICKSIAETYADKSASISASVSPYYDNNAYYLNVYEVFTDIRMVFAPPSSVGKFGGDTDNWMWPRHTGDFSVFRVYANAENKPAAYSQDNVPYKPKYFVPISLNGYREGSYSMTIGYPGRTNRYLSSWGVEQRIKSNNTPRIEVRGIKQDIWDEAMRENDEVRIKYSSKYAGSSNYWKNSIGMNRGIEKMHVIERKQALEKQFNDWINLDPQRKAFYGEALDLIREGYTATNEDQKTVTYLGESLITGTELTYLTSAAMAFDVAQQPDILAKKFEEDILPLYKDYEASLDEKVLAAMLKIAKERVPAEKLPLIYQKIDKKYKGDYTRYAADVFKKSVVPYPEKLKAYLLDYKKAPKLEKDPAYELVKSIREAFSAVRTTVTGHRYDILKGERLYFSGLQQMMPEKDFASDANSTMRLSYGSVGGYVPYDGAWYDYYTTTGGIFEKYKKDDPEFDVQPEILDLLRKKDFGIYGNLEGDMNICFLSNNDITGGNSGSPMFDEKGRLIGLAFDGNWEAMSGDIAFESQIQKTIGVDIRYVMFMIDKWGKCSRIVKEVVIE